MFEKSKEIGVYRIRNLINGRIYIGKTNKGFNKRCGHHRCMLKNGNHESPIMQEDFNRFGIENFVFEPLVICDEMDNWEIEMECIIKFNPEYNHQSKYIPWCLAVKWSDIGIDYRTRKPINHES